MTYRFKERECLAQIADNALSLISQEDVDSFDIDIMFGHAFGPIQVFTIFDFGRFHGDFPNLVGFADFYLKFYQKAFLLELGDLEGWTPGYHRSCRSELLQRRLFELTSSNTCRKVLLRNGLLEIIRVRLILRLRWPDLVPAIEFEYGVQYLTTSGVGPTQFDFDYNVAGPWIRA